MDAREIGNFIRTRRTGRALSLGDLSAASGIERGHLSLIEQGKVLVTRRTAEKLERALGTGDGGIWRQVLLAKTPAEVQALISAAVAGRFIEGVEAVSA